MSNLQETQGWQLPMKLRDLLEQLNSNPKDVDLYHWDFDMEINTMVERSLKDFTENGLVEFKATLDMEVVRVTDESDTWLSVWVKGESCAHVESLSRAHAGYCSVDDYANWFTMDSKP